HYGMAELTHKIYNNLTTRLDFSATHETVDASKEEKYLGNLNLDYQKGIFWDGRLSASAGLGYGLTNRVSSGELVPITDESHVVAIGGIVLLKQRFISTATIVVTNLDGSIQYTEGADYDVVPVSGDNTELRILGGGLIAVGQTILVDYRYLPAPTMKYSQIPYHFNIDMDFDWISIYQEISGIQYEQFSGDDDTFLNNRFSSKTGIRLRWNEVGFQAAAAADYTHSADGDLTTDSINFNQSLTYNFGYDASLSAGAGQTFIVSDGRLSEVYSANLSGSWNPLRGLYIRPFVSAWMNKSEATSDSASDAIDDAFVTAGFSLRWRVRSVDVSMQYNHDYRNGTTSDAAEDRFRLTLSRKF
ncbi:MAG: hypothetical protein OEY85_14640, partial [Rhodospirillales bacterium]|nr:hypothetical protein [Rhodospirillales bacterium]